MEGKAMPQVVVLAGGLGTRLGSISERVPKSLIEVAGQPILSHILDWVAAQGCSSALVLICLLYTSPSPRDVEESRMPSSA